MRPFPVQLPTPQIPEGSGWCIAFQAVNSVGLAVVTSKLLLDMLRDRHEARHKPRASAEELGPLVRREVERALAEHDARSRRSR